MVEVDKIGVHRTHCCIIHGCKYGNKDCPVVLAEVEQEYLCEGCEMFTSDEKREKSWFKIKQVMRKIKLKKILHNENII